MVCLKTSTKFKNSNYDTEIKDITESTELDVSMDGTEEQNDDLKLKRIAGGSIVKYPPLFSPDEEAIFVIFEDIIQVYSTLTGELIRTLEGMSNPIVAMNYKISNSKILIGCSRSGEVIEWNWKKGSIEHKRRLPQKFEKCTIRTFNLVDLSQDRICAFVVYKICETDEKLEWDFIDITNSKIINYEKSFTLKYFKEHVHVDVDNTNFHYVAVTLAHKLYLFNFETFAMEKHRNIHRNKFTAVRCHPTEEIVATGDTWGKVLLWRNLFKNGQPQTTQYHWHHTIVTCLSFTDRGTNFYSGGLESVLMKWNVYLPHIKRPLPRMSDFLRHIAVSEGNTYFAVCTADNGIQIYGSYDEKISIIQNFTYISNKKTQVDRFPFGLKVNPRNNCLALNGRQGHIQFYSTYTRSLLYNMDITMQNLLSTEKHKILYNIHVTHAAFHIDWMATGELWDDREYTPRTRLKFWIFDKQNQRYALNTNIELPHQKGFRTIEFSSQHETENLLCGTLGLDNDIKMWSLDTPNNNDENSFEWVCIHRIRYKESPIQAINFSQDGSLLVAGSKNTLCIYDSKTVNLKVSLTAPFGLDGTVQVVNVLVPKKTRKSAVKTTGSVSDKNDIILKRKKTVELFQSFIQNDCYSLAEIIKNKASTCKDAKSVLEQSKPQQSIQSKNLSEEHKQTLFRKILSFKELNLFQKISLYQRLSIHCTVPNNRKLFLFNYLKSSILKTNRIESDLSKSVKRISTRYRFKAKYRLDNYLTSRSSCSESARNLVPLLDLLQLNKYDEQSDEQITRNNNTTTDVTIKENGNCTGFSETEAESNATHISTRRDTSVIKQVLFGSGENAHLVVACTENRVLIWNLLTLRLQTVLKMSVDKIVVDTNTNLFAAFTINNELYIFSPNAPIPLYHRVNMPKVFGAAWIPRQYPKSQSLNLDWQSTSILCFLTDKQELMCLLSEKDVDPLFTSATYFNEMRESFVQYSAFGAFAINQINAKIQSKPNVHATFGKIGVPGKESIISLIESASHTMAPMNLLCNRFIKSFLISEKDSKTLTEKSVSSNDDDNDDDNRKDISDSDDDDKYTKDPDDIDIDRKIEKRKSRLDRLPGASSNADYSIGSTNRISSNPNKLNNKQIKGVKVKNIFNEKIELDF